MSTHPIPIYRSEMFRRPTRVEPANYRDFRTGFKTNYSYDERKSWSLTDRFGKELIPDRKGIIEDRVVLSDELCYLIVKENDKIDAYRLYSSRTNIDESYAYKYPEEDKVINFFDACFYDDTVILKSEKGLCFISAKDGKQKSDFYTGMYLNNYKWLYYKTIKYGKYETTITGPISLDGNVGSLCYDKFFNKNRDVVVQKSKEGNYDIIKTDEIKADLKQYALEQRQLAKAKKALAKIR